MRISDWSSDVCSSDLGAAQETNERIAGGRTAGRWTGMAGLAALIDLACGDAGQPHPRAFGTPNRTVAIPDHRRRAGKAGASGKHGRKNEGKNGHNGD